MSPARDQILSTTCALLETQGYHGTGLNQIIKESGSPKGSLYYYFPGGKEELAEVALRHIGQIVLDRIKMSLAAVEDVAEAVRSFILTLVYYVEAADYRAGGPITTVALETAATNERLRAECQNIYAAWQTAFADKLIASGLRHERAERLAALIIASIEGGIILCRTQRSPKPLQSIAEELALLIKNAM
jgi:TetR/AcrR family transcriptional regulator, lmrAB and yxaGH operons repressor